MDNNPRVNKIHVDIKGKKGISRKLSDIDSLGADEATSNQTFLKSNLEAGTIIGGKFMTDENPNIHKIHEEIKDKRKSSRALTDIDRLDIGETPSNQTFSKATRIPEAEAAINKMTSGRPASKKAEVAQKMAEAKAKAQDLDNRDVLSAGARKGITSIHIVVAGDTLSSIALKYYGKATPPYYQLIYQHNLEVIGSNINIIVPGQKLVIPDLPDELK